MHRIFESHNEDWKSARLSYFQVECFELFWKVFLVQYNITFFCTWIYYCTDYKKQSYNKNRSTGDILRLDGGGLYRRWERGTADGQQGRSPVYLGPVRRYQPPRSSLLSHRKHPLNFVKRRSTSHSCFNSGSIEEGKASGWGCMEWGGGSLPSCRAWKTLPKFK